MFNIEIQHSTSILQYTYSALNNFIIIYNKRITMASPSSSKFAKLVGPEFDLDCQNPQCYGWMNFFAKRGEETPCFLRCANSSKNTGGSCTVNCIFFATKEGTCPACSKENSKFIYILFCI